LLTNDTTYWQAPVSTDTADRAFRLHDGRHLSGELSWGPRASAGTTAGREVPHRLQGRHELRWHDYSTLEEQSAGRRFRFLHVNVTAADLKQSQDSVTSTSTQESKHLE
jgi:hypothetical protein